jgi:hypothetical protein
VERRGPLVVFFVALAFCALVTKPRAISWNDISRLATVDSLVSRHTFAIDGSPFAARTADKYRYAGRTYSDKPPALELQGAAVAAALAPLGISLERTPGTAIYLITLFTAGVWFALGCAYAYAFQRLLGFGQGTARLVAALSGLGTLALPYASILSNHVPAGAAALAGAYHLVRARDSTAQAALGALFLTLSYAFDSAAIVLAILAVLLLWRAPARTWTVFAAACVPIVAAQLAFNAAVSGALGPPAMNQASWADPFSPFNRGAHQSVFFFSSAADYARYALYVLFGDKGLISYTPLVLVSAYGFALMWRTSPMQRRIVLAIAATFAAYLVLIVAFTNDYGALNFGQRRYVDLIFLLCVGLGPALAKLQTGAAAVVARIAIVWSIAVAMLGTVAPFGQSRGEAGYAFALEDFVRLTHRAPVQAALDVIALLLTVLLVLRFWSSSAAPTSGSGRLVA